MTTFEKPKLSIVVMEVGVGGRLDTTNAIPNDAVVRCCVCSDQR